MTVGVARKGKEKRGGKGRKSGKESEWRGERERETVAY